MTQVAAATQIQSLAWKLPYATSVAIKKKKKLMVPPKAEKMSRFWSLFGYSLIKGSNSDAEILPLT